MKGTILLESLEIECIVGIHPHERSEPQKLLIDVELDRDFDAAQATEDVEHTVDYVELADALTELAVRGRFHLIETYAERAAEMIIEKFRADRVALEVKKPAAVPRARWAAVRVERFA